jgi:hypothetical protein
MALVGTQRACVGWAVLIAAGIAGCSSAPTTYTVVGKVVYKGTGEPATRLEDGFIILEPITEPGAVSVQGGIDEEGMFRLGTIVGGKTYPGAVAGEFRGRIDPPSRRAVAHKYTQFDTSGIRITISGDRQDLVVEVEPGNKK